MFEKLFTDSVTIARYRDAPLLEERLRYLSFWFESGAVRGTLRRIAADQMSLVRLLDLREGVRVNVAGVEAAAGRWSRPGVRRCPKPALPTARRRFIGRAVRWLRFVDMLEESRKARHAHTHEVAAFEAWMRDERGWADETIRGCCNTLDRFFDWLDGRGVALASLGIAEIDEALARHHARGCSRVTIHNYAQRLRGFLRFAERRGWCVAGLADAIMPPRRHRGETIPKGLTRDEVIRLLATTEGDRPSDLRDRAILMALITYGLRAGEVAGLRLDDLDWDEEMLRVRCPKPGRTHLYPLSHGFGRAVLRYLREVRPARPDRELFLTLKAPIKPVGRSTVKGLVRARLDVLGITGKRLGPHALRHAAAQHLLDRGLSMKAVGDYLGHRTLAATSVYARVRLEALREVAAIDLGGLI
ncbi:MAG: tyrosine-type recombinase/integrase [Alphaproteobacteria bacterium]|nr:tyrosine-type recombinase/integrase [Alphaproteobacteria bacterium]